MDTFAAIMRSLWTVWLVLLFSGLVLWVMLPKNRDRLRGYGTIPLNDDDPDASTGPAPSAPASTRDD